jgi:transcriptional regulator with XRE-family HTH domain
MPVYSSHLLGYAALNVGPQLRDARQRRDLSLRDVAARVGFSAARLSEIENGHHVLDLRQAMAIAQVLSVPLSTFVPADVGVPYQITREADLRTRPGRRIPLHPAQGPDTRHHNEFWPYAEFFIGRHLEPVFTRIMPVNGDQPRFWHHHEEEFLFVLQGEVEFLIRTPEGLRREELRRGDCVAFRSSLPHCLRALTPEPAEAIDVFAGAAAPLETGFEWLSYRQSSFVEDTQDAPAMRRVGDRLRALREVHGWTIEQVAEVIGISSRRLQRIEEGVRPVPLDAMLRLARAFGRPIRDLVGNVPEAPHYVLRRSGDIASLPNRVRQTPVERPSAPQSKTCQPLALGFAVRQMFPYFVRLRNASAETLTHHEHHSHEFIYVLDGELELMTFAGEQEVTEILRPGDTCYLDSTVPHLVRGRSRNPYSDTSAEVLDVFWSPLGEQYLFRD